MLLRCQNRECWAENLSDKAFSACDRSETQHDARAVDLFRVECAPAHTIIPLLHARLIPLHHNLADFAGNGEIHIQGLSLGLESTPLSLFHAILYAVVAVVWNSMRYTQRLSPTLDSISALLLSKLSKTQPAQSS